eukprot:5216922-Ditylum_brightwellii.AAC.1
MKLASARDFLALGLDLDGWTGWRKCSEKTNSNRFKKIYGAYSKADDIFGGSSKRQHDVYAVT